MGWVGYARARRYLQRKMSDENIFSSWLYGANTPTLVNFHQKMEHFSSTNYLPVWDEGVRCQHGLHMVSEWWMQNHVSPSNIKAPWKRAIDYVVRTQGNFKETVFHVTYKFLQVLWPWLSPLSPPGHKWQLTNAQALGGQTTTEQAPRWAGRGTGDSIHDGHFIRFYSRNLFFTIFAKQPNLSSILRVKGPNPSPTPRAGADSIQHHNFERRENTKAQSSKASTGDLCSLNLNTSGETVAIPTSR